jgi:transcriptional regulator of arginine metabolism
MNKSFRQGQILQIVRSKGIYTQDELARELGERGVQTTQVTLSRDMREIGLVKTADGYRQLAAEKGGPELASVVDDHMQDIRVAQNLVVLKTSPGIAIDREELDDVVGTVAGDDTVLVIAADQEAAERFHQKLLALISD